MKVLETFINAAGVVLDHVIFIYVWVIIIAAIISWTRPNPYNPIVQSLYRLTEPVYDFIRRRVRTDFGGLDIAPIIVLLGLQFTRHFLVNLMVNFQA
ncbi:MAG: YggT family protein [Helicobacteraceae bacterium]|jgi:YggT family protein|nr:YggT family protein [Helicobacteraceae bacterium]